jgi:hypothetical protein
METTSKTGIIKKSICTIILILGLVFYYPLILTLIALITTLRNQAILGLVTLIIFVCILYYIPKNSYKKVFIIFGFLLLGYGATQLLFTREVVTKVAVKINFPMLCDSVGFKDTCGELACKRADLCLREVATINHNLEACKMMDDSALDKGKCLAAQSADVLQISLCNNFDSKQDLQYKMADYKLNAIDCYSDFAKKYSDVSLCESSMDEDIKAKCIEKYAEANNDNSICSKITIVSKKYPPTFCKSYISI